jgi:hypothetical protein
MLHVARLRSFDSHLLFSYKPSLARMAEVQRTAPAPCATC